MRIFYAVQATGNGHISRAMELLPHLQKYGEVDILLSGANSTLNLDAPVRYRSKGLSLFYNCKGGLNLSKIIAQLSLPRIRREIRDLPVEKYDLILNDFDCLTSLSCARKKIPSVNFGHQASFMSAKTPRPSHISRTGEWILRNYAKATHYAGLHFEKYDDFIFTPVIKKAVFGVKPVDRGYITVYLPSYCQPELLHYFAPLKEYRFQVFSWQVKQPEKHAHITFLPVSGKGFNESLINCSAIICGAGFETPAEALHLNKKMMVMPIKGQYEQYCNAAALERLGIKCLPGLDSGFHNTFDHWIRNFQPPAFRYTANTATIVEQLMEMCERKLQFSVEEEITIDELANAGL
ncbi:MAG TPA: glycosyltransferase family protein [Chitinophagaceae bacterium]